jgi:hypothetical protein
MNFAENAGETSSSFKGGETMQVRIDITRRDYWKLNKYSVLHNPITGIIFFIIMLGAPLLLLVKLLGDSDDRTTAHIVATIITALVFGGLFDLMFYILLKIIVMFVPSGRLGVLGEHYIEIHEKGIHETTAVNDDFRYWKGVCSIKQSNEYIFVFLESYMAHIIPKRSFSSLQEAGAFYNNAVEFWSRERQR